MTAHLFGKVPLSTPAYDSSSVWSTCSTALLLPAYRSPMSLWSAELVDTKRVNSSALQDNPFADMGKLMENVKRAQELVKTEGARVQEELSK